DAGKGVEPSQLADLAAHDPRSAVRRETVDGRPLEAHLHALGLVAAAEAALGSLDGRRAAVEPGPEADALVAALAARGLTAVDHDVTADADVLFCGSRQGMIDGTTAAT